jgi:hypothetical protein
MKENYYRNNVGRKRNSPCIEINKHRHTPKQNRNVRQMVRHENCVITQKSAVIIYFVGGWLPAITHGQKCCESRNHHFMSLLSLVFKRIRHPCIPNHDSSTSFIPCGVSYMPAFTYIGFPRARLTLFSSSTYKTQVECVLPSAKRHICLQEISTNNCEIYITVYIKGCEANFIWASMYPQ